MQESVHLKYLVTSPQDRKIGLTITSIGTQNICANESYPPLKHPTRYHFDPEKGRILYEYQLLILTKGSGIFQSASMNQPAKIKEGDMFLLFPGEWHSYRPDPDTGWTEYWVGFYGDIADGWFRNGIISKEHPVFHAGKIETFGNLYRQAMECADKQESGYQQMLCGIVCNLLSSCIYYDKNASFRQDSIQELIAKVRRYINDNIECATPEGVAAFASVSYSKLRKLFRQYTGLTLGKYIAQVRTNKAKEMLSNTDYSVGDIASRLNFFNEEYFSTYFKRITGESPSQYRQRIRQFL
ncbi:MAG: AraC family transcriptional regulator [Bacteroidales bacterium]|nr:AraC family transcriptional regulator [Bacteroidales bacterium]